MYELGFEFNETYFIFVHRNKNKNNIWIKKLWNFAQSWQLLNFIRIILITDHVCSSYEKNLLLE